MTSQLIKIVETEFSNTFVRDYEGNVLVQRRDGDIGNFPGYLAPFGGAHEEGDYDATEAALRELWEETFMLKNDSLIKPIGVYVMPFNFDKEDPRGYPKKCYKFKEQGFTHWINHIFLYEANYPITNVIVREGNPEVIKAGDFDLKKFSDKGRPPFMSNYGIILDRILNKAELSDKIIHTELPPSMLYANVSDLNQDHVKLIYDDRVDAFRNNLNLMDNVSIEKYIVKRAA